ncbi:pre-rRNA-processing protein pno1 [Ceratobasidium sp. 394]|nr:pre-rRNA-processing protein pno1 [Ceratobasidium sp. 394]
MAPVVSPSAPASSSKTKSKTRRSKHSAKQHLIAAQPPNATSVTEDLIPLDDVIMSGVVGEENAEAGAGMDVGATLTFPALPASAQRATEKSETRRIAIPPHRMTPLKKDWVNIFSPLTEMLGLQVRMNVHKRAVEIRTSRHTKDVGAIQKGADFVKAYALGFDINDAIALLRLDDLYLDSFEIKDVKTLHGDHLSRAIGRLAGHDGKTKFTIENASRTRIVLADTKIHILGSFQNIKIARDALVSLILGSPPGKVYAGLRTVGARMRQRAI